MPDIDFHLFLTGPTGTLDLDDNVLYESEAATLNERAVTWRKRSISAEWVEGTFDVFAVKENVTESVQTWVTAETPYALEEAIQRLADAYGQLSYQIKLVWGDLTEVWRCMPANYTVQSSGPLMIATKALFTAQVPRLPTTVRTRTGTSDRMAAGGPSTPVWAVGT